METILFFFLLVSFAVGVFATLWLHKGIKDLRKALLASEKKISELEQQVAAQNRQIEKLKKESSTGGALPLAQVINSLGLIKNKGIVPGVMALGMTLFQAYWSSKRTQTTKSSLPLRRKNESL